ncbi:zeta toxin family protein [Aliarcobacter butzleri]|uniref:zeta toxin family protein n=1 Tax=Arcobacteraceae TaxID=2808963 RepID=UPI0021BB9F5B|nr:zeta toxin family protein [Arcobacter lacus]MCT7910724.1 zeta toxin family protein [Arcobacter lacus]
MKQIDEIVIKKFDLVWQEQILDKSSSAIPYQNKPQGFILGGQPGAGKSNLLLEAKKKLNRNILEINGDNFRKYHPDYKKLQKEKGQDTSIYTQEFAAKMANAILSKAINEKYNIVIEGTFRTVETPIRTLKQLKDNGYETNVLVQTCKQEISWDSCLERYEKALKNNPNDARFTPKEHHDLVVTNLAKNVKEVAKSGLVDNMQVFARIPVKGKPNEFTQKEIYNSNSKKIVNSATIEKYIFGERKISLDNGLSNGL